jgi:hypothetical protein
VEPLDQGGAGAGGVDAAGDGELDELGLAESSISSSSSVPVSGSAPAGVKSG